MANAHPLKLISSSGIDQTATEPLMLWQELDSLRHDITSIRSEITSFTLRRADGKEVNAAALGTSDRAAKLLMSTIEGRESLLMRIVSAFSTARVEVKQLHVELNEMYNDARREDALRRGIIPFAGGD